MKILQINKLYYPAIGGIEKVVKDIAEEVTKDKNLEVEVLCCQSGWSNTKKEIINNVPVLRAGSMGTISSMPLSLQFPLLLRRKIKSFDLLHFHLPFPLAVLSCCLIRPKVPVIVTYHSDIVRQKFIRWLLFPFDYWFLKKAKAILVSTDRIIESSYLLRYFKNKCRVVPFGVALDRFKRTKDIKSRVGEIHKKYGNRIVLFVGRLVIYKGVDYLIEVMKNIDAELIIVGDGFLYPYLKRQVRDLKLEKKVIFLGNIADEELINFYWAASVFVLPSITRNEVFGIVLLEAMACQLPVISTEIGTATSVINQGNKTGYVVSPKDPQSLARAIKDILDSPKMATLFGKNSYERVKKHFMLDVMTKDIKQIYLNVSRKTS